MTERTDVGTVEDLHESASRLVGLDDFGGDEDNYREALGVILDSYQREAGLTPFGSKISRVYLRGALAARLLSQAAWRQYPHYADVAIERPIFVTGLPRTGTTALHRLLTADPAHQGLEMWLAEYPQPRPPRESWDANPVYRQLEEQFEQHHVEHPEFMGLHYMSAGEVEECWQLLRQSVHSVAYETLAHIPSYAHWLAKQDWTPTYRRYRKNLQLIGLNDVGKRWVMKNPSHLFALDALMATFPDALVVPNTPPRAGHTCSGARPSAPIRSTRGREVWSGSSPNARNTIRPSSTTSITRASSPTPSERSREFMSISACR
jgi:hypothetical protein